MEQVAHMLGVRLEEEFKLEGTDYKYKFSKDGMKWYSELYGDWIIEPENIRSYSILYPWSPNLPINHVLMLKIYQQEVEK